MLLHDCINNDPGLRLFRRPLVPASAEAPFCLALLSKHSAAEFADRKDPMANTPKCVTHTMVLTDIVTLSVRFLLWFPQHYQDSCHRSSPSCQRLRFWREAAGFTCLKLAGSAGLEPDAVFVIPMSVL